MSRKIDTAYFLIAEKIAMFKNVLDPKPEEMFKFGVFCVLFVFFAIVISLSIDLSR